MNLESLKSYINKNGNIIKNYRQLCEITEEKYCTGKSKQLHLEYFKKCFSWENDKHKFIIHDIKDEAPYRLKSNMQDLLLPLLRLVIKCRYHTITTVSDNKDKDKLSPEEEIERIQGIDKNINKEAWISEMDVCEGIFLSSRDFKLQRINYNKFIESSKMDDIPEEHYNQCVHYIWDYFRNSLKRAIQKLEQLGEIEYTRILVGFRKSDNKLDGSYKVCLSSSQEEEYEKLCECSYKYVSEIVTKTRKKETSINNMSSLIWWNENINEFNLMKSYQNKLNELCMEKFNLYAIHKEYCVTIKDEFYNKYKNLFKGNEFWHAAYAYYQAFMLKQQENNNKRYLTKRKEDLNYLKCIFPDEQFSTANDIPTDIEDALIGYVYNPELLNRKGEKGMIGYSQYLEDLNKLKDNFIKILFYFFDGKRILEALVLDKTKIH